MRGKNKKMIELLGYNFFTHALLASVFAGISCGFIGTYIVTRRIVFISGGISHASFGGVGVAYYFGFNPVLGAALFSILSAVGIEAFSRKSTLRKDTLIGIMWSFGMAVGIIFIYLTPGYTANLMTYLFGNILTVTAFDLYLMAGLTLIIIFFFLLLLKEILYISFDEEYSRTQGIPVALINYVLIGLVALTIVINIRVVGIILVISLLTIPQATANLISKDFKSIIFYSIGFGFVSSISGLFLSYKLNIPSGATIIFSSILLFLIVRLGLVFHNIAVKRKYSI
jgi:zinc transport system permease protein